MTEEILVKFRNSYHPLTLGLILLALVILPYDIWYTVQVVNGEPIRHAPFLYPLVLACFIGMVEWDRISGQTPEQFARMQAERRRVSTFSPENFSVERAADGCVE